MEGGTAADGRRASMYDPARDIFARDHQDEHDGSGERGTRDNSTSHGQSTGSTAPTAVSQPIESLHSVGSGTTTTAPLSTEPVESKSAVTPKQREEQRLPVIENKSASKESNPFLRSTHPLNSSTSTSPHSSKPALPKKSPSMADQPDPYRSNQIEAQNRHSSIGATQSMQSPGEKRKTGEDEPAGDTAGQNGRQQPSTKRRRREERPQRAPRREAPTAYSRRDRSPINRYRDSRNSRSVSPGRRAADFRRSRSPLPRERSVTPEVEARQRKRPGGGARLGTAGKDLLRRRQEEREIAQQREVERDLRDRGVSDVVRQHYNAVPERGREWRKTDSKIKGLRSFNNWIKSTVIQKFSPDEDFLARKAGTKEWAADGDSPGERKKLLVVDLGCGKGGDLGKWQQAPQPVDLYVGLDPAEISIDQARDRYNGMRNNRNQRNRRGNALFHAEFHPKDCFGEWLGDLRIIQEVGIDANVGPNANLMNARWGGGGFDVVVSMFTMHYAFESEEKARQMLQNVSGALKKGGRFIGVGPNSDVISVKVAEFHKQRKAQKEEGTTSSASKEKEKGEEEAPEDGEVEDEQNPEWGNGIYRVRFPGSTPEDGVFRPPFGWKYSYFMEEAVEEIPEYVVPWEAFRYLTTEYNLELLYRRPFLEIWNEEKDDPELGPLSERMGVRARGGGEILVSDAELDAAGFYHAFVFQKI